MGFMCSANKAYFSLFPILIHTFSSEHTVLFLLLFLKNIFSELSHPRLPVNIYFAGRSMTKGAKGVSTLLTTFKCLFAFNCTLIYLTLHACLLLHKP